jgi:hypothetical protein
MLGCETRQKLEQESQFVFSFLSLTNPTTYIQN